MWPERRKKAPFNKDIEWLGISVLRKGSFNGWKVVDGYTFLKPEDGDAWNTSPTLEFKEAFSIPHQKFYAACGSAACGAGLQVYQLYHSFVVNYHTSLVTVPINYFL